MNPWSSSCQQLFSRRSPSRCPALRCRKALVRRCGMYKMAGLRRLWHPYLPALLLPIPYTVQERAKEQSMKNLEDAIISLRQTFSSQHSARSHFDLAKTFTLANACRLRYEQSDKLKDLEEAVGYCREILASFPDSHRGRFFAFDDLGSLLSARYKHSNKTEDLDEAIMCRRSAITLRPLGHPRRSDALHNLGCNLHSRYIRSGKMDDLEEAITYHRQALLGNPVGNWSRSSSLCGLAASVYARYKQSDRVEDLEEVVSYYREALIVCPVDHSSYPVTFNCLVHALYTCYEQSGRMDIIEEVITYYREAPVLPLDHPCLSTRLYHIGNSLYVRYHESGRVADLEEAVTCHRQALALCSLQNLDRANTLNSLALALISSYEQSGRTEDLEEAITYYHEALVLCTIDHSLNHFNILNNLANALYTHFQQSGRMEVLEESIIYHREVLNRRPVGSSHSKRSGSLNNLASAVFVRYAQLGRVEDLEESITSYREAISLRPSGHRANHDTLNNLANAISARYDKSKSSIEDLEEAIMLHRESIALLGPGHSCLPNSLRNLAGAIHERNKRLGRMEDLDEAISYLREAINLCPLGHISRSSFLHGLANAIHDRFDQSKCPSIEQDLEECFTLYQQAASDSTSSLRYRLEAAKKWALVARQQHHHSVICAYSTAFLLLDRSLTFYPNIDSQKRFLATAEKSIASDAASAAIDSSELEAAVELLEQGRALLWAKMEGYRRPLDQLRQTNRWLADHLQDLSTRFENLTLSPESKSLDNDKPETTGHLEAQIRRHRILTEEWESAVGRVRKLEGFSDFLQAVPFSTLQTAAAEGPVIVINISEYRSDALILLVAKSPILVTLPNIHPEQLTGLATELAKARTKGTPNSSKIIYSILRKLWNNIVSPVIDRLDQLGIPKKSRVWWCPTSELCGLPLHAAGPYQPNRKNLPDLYTSSYTPTLSALIRARSNRSNQSTVPKLLVIGQPSDGLPYVQDEINNLRQLGDFVDIIAGAEATGEAVIGGLQQHSWAHFACHGYLGDNAQPFHAAFQLHSGGRLKLLELIRARLPNAELAFLSACHSAVGELSTPNETINLAAALQFCGFRSVIGTLWTMEDKDGPNISSEFYKHMFRNPGNMADFRDSAEALSLAIRALRKQCVPLERWITFVHIGA